MSQQPSSIIGGLVQGLFFGVGFTAALMAGIALAPPAVTLVQKTPETKRTARAGDYTKDLIIVSHLSYRERRARNRLVMLGKLQNKGAAAWKDIEIQAEFFLKGDYVDECHAFIRIMRPGEEDNFKIVCGECANEAPPVYDNIIIKVAAAAPE